MQRTPGSRRRVSALAAGAALVLAAVAAVPILATDPPKQFTRPTTSSPIQLSNNNALLWVVNPDDDSVSVIRTDTNAVIATIDTGREPRAVAVDPSDSYAYVVNAADNSLTVIRILNANPSAFSAKKVHRFITGAEPWNVVISPDGKRVFVANSGQDTISIIDAERQRLIGNLDLRSTECNDPDRERRFQPRGLAVNVESTKLYVSGFFAYTKPGKRQVDDQGREGFVCRIDINTHASKPHDYVPGRQVRLQPTNTGFTVDKNGDGVADPTFAWPNQLQSIVLRGDKAYLPNIAASPEGPLRFNTSTQAYVSIINGVGGSAESDGGAINLHLGARVPEAGKPRLFFANPWGVVFTTQSGAGNAYVISAGSDLLVKLNVDAAGNLSNTVGATTTRYIDLNDPDNPNTSGEKAGKNPLGIAINNAGTRAYTANFVSRNVSIIDLNADAVAGTIRTTKLPVPGSRDEVVQVGAEMFFSTRGNFNRPAGTTVSTRNRLSSEGWQNCASCHFAGWTDGVVWAFGAGPRKSVPLNASFNPHDKSVQRILNYSAIFDEVDDFENNIRNVSGPGGLNLQGKPAVACNAPIGAAVSPTNLDPDHGLLISDNGDINQPPCEQNAFLTKANGGRPQHTVTLPGSNVAVPALTALREWVRFAVRTPEGALTSRHVKGGVPVSEVRAGRKVFEDAGCASCHGGSHWTLSKKDFISPPPADRVSAERVGTFTGNPVGAQSIFSVLRDIGSFGIGIPAPGKDFGNNIGPDEKAAPAVAIVNGVLTAAAAQDALGIDYNSDGRGIGYNVPSLLGIGLLPPYYHNGACEQLECVLSDQRHRTAGNKADILADPKKLKQLVRFLESIDARTQPVN